MLEDTIFVVHNSALNTVIIQASIRTHEPINKGYSYQC